jgi:hypothetical protein
MIKQVNKRQGLYQRLKLGIIEEQSLQDYPNTTQMIILNQIIARTKERFH